MKDVISNLKISNSSASFRAPGSFAALSFPTFPEKIKETMDLCTIEMKLKNKGYQTLETFLSDFDLIINNCYMTWGRNCSLSKNAARIQALFQTQMKMLPALGLPEPPTTLTDARAEKAAIAGKSSRSTYMDDPSTEPATRRRSAVGIIKIEMRRSLRHYLPTRFQPSKEHNRHLTNAVDLNLVSMLSSRQRRQGDDATEIHDC
jgi:hypothetical protein